MVSGLQAGAGRRLGVEADVGNRSPACHATHWPARGRGFALRRRGTRPLLHHTTRDHRDGWTTTALADWAQVGLTRARTGYPSTPRGEPTPHPQGARDRCLSWTMSSRWASRSLSWPACRPRSSSSTTRRIMTEKDHDTVMPYSCLGPPDERGFSPKLLECKCIHSAFPRVRCASHYAAHVENSLRVTRYVRFAYCVVPATDSATPADPALLRLR